MRMSKLEINPEEIDRGSLIAIAVAAVAVAGIALVAVRKGPKDPNGWHRACVDRPGLLLLQVTIH